MKALIYMFMSHYNQSQHVIGIRLIDNAFEDHSMFFVCPPVLLLFEEHSAQVRSILKHLDFL